MRHIIFVTILWAILSPWAEQNYGKSQSIQEWAANISEANETDILQTTYIQVDRASRRLHELITSWLAEITGSK
jgi:hypothetical protein